MRYNVKLINNILKLNILSYDEFNRFLIDIDKVFKNNMDEFVKIMMQFSNGKRQFLNRNYNNFIAEYRNLLSMFLGDDAIDYLLDQLSNVNSYKNLLEFMKYINQNIEIKDKMIECINGLDHLNITSVDFVNELAFSVECSETKDGNYHKLNSVYSDGKNSVEFTKSNIYTNYYIIDVKDANYIIYYSKDNINGLIDINVYVKNLEFDPKTLPEYNKIHGKNCWQNINNKDKRISFQK